MKGELVKALLLNVGILLIVAGSLTNIKFVRRLLQEKDENLKNKVVLGVMFGLMSVMSTYLGLGVQGAIVNTRVIAVLASGILGGPVVGMIAAVIGGAHRLLFYIGGFTALACSVSTLCEGIIGSVAYIYFQKRETTVYRVGLIAAGAEVMQMVMILLIARPFPEALALVQTIGLPMILINSFGIMLFFSTFNDIFKEREGDISHYQGVALDIAKRSLPHLRNGLKNRQSMQQVADIIGQTMPEYRAIITGGEQVIADSLGEVTAAELPKIASAAMEQDALVVSNQVADIFTNPKEIRQYYAMAAPLRESEQSGGCLVIAAKKQRFVKGVNESFTEGLAELFSTMLELSQISHESSMRRKAEFKALQAQINPHFLYNALNTLSSICREDPLRTRQLLVVLAKYFRHILEINKEFIPLEEEIESIKAYLELEYARFEDKLHVTWKIQENLCCILPPLILQPIVENAVKHGADEQGVRSITITIEEVGDSTVFTVSDRGQGFRQDCVGHLFDDKNVSDSYSGIYNVHRRLKSVYHGNGGLLVENRTPGALVRFEIPHAAGEEHV